MQCGINHLPFCRVRPLELGSVKRQYYENRVFGDGTLQVAHPKIKSNIIYIYIYRYEIYMILIKNQTRALPTLDS